MGFVKMVLASTGASVEITLPSEHASVLAASGFMRKYAPQGVWMAKGAETDCSLRVAVVPENELSLGYPASSMSMRTFSVADTLTMAEYMLERARQEKGIYCLHASAALLRGEGYVFWGGASGIGKSSMALGVARLPGGSMLYDEKALIDLSAGSLVGGVSELYLTRPHHAALNASVRWENNGEPSYARPIRIMVLPVVLAFDGRVDVEKVSDAKYAWHMYEEITRKIRGVSRTFFGNRTVGSLDTDTLADARLAAVASFCARVPCEYIAGSSSQAVEYLARL